MANNTDSIDACPFTPDAEPPAKTMITNMLEIMDSFFEGWRNTAIVVSLISLFLAYSLAISIPPLITQSYIPSTWGDDLNYYPSPSGFEYLKIPEVSPETLVSEDLVLDGDDVLELENTVYQVNGDVYLRDNSKLVLRNSSLVLSINPRYRTINPSIPKIVCSNHSSFVIEDSNIFTSEFSFYLISEGRSDLRIHSSHLNGSLYLTDSSTIITSDSSIRGIRYSKSAKGSIVDSQLLFLRNRDYHYNPRESEYVLNDDGELLIDGSTIHYFSIKLAGTCNISKPVLGYHADWDPKQGLGFSGDSFGISLRDTSILNSVHLEIINGTCWVNQSDEEPRISLLNSNLVVDESFLSYISSDVLSDVTLRDSVVRHFSIANEHHYMGFNPFEGEVFESDILRSNIGYFIINQDCSLNFDESILHNIEMKGNDVKIRGDVTYGPWIDFGIPKDWYSRYPQFVYTQEYTVRLQGDKHLLPNIPISVTNSTGATVWDGETNREGEARFNISYCNYYPLNRKYSLVTNYNDTWTLHIDNDGEIIQTPIRFLETSSVIKVSISEPNILALMDFSTTSQTGLGAILLIVLIKLLKGTSN